MTFREKDCVIINPKSPHPSRGHILKVCHKFEGIPVYKVKVTENHSIDVLTSEERKLMKLYIPYEWYFLETQLELLK